MPLRKGIMRVLNWIVVAVFLTVSGAFDDVHDRLRVHVIVDTDVALDDVRALALLSQSDKIHLLAVVTSDGACAPDKGSQNIRHVLRLLGQSDVPIAPGKSLDEPSPPWRAMSESLGWSKLGKVNANSHDNVRELQDRITFDEEAIKLIIRIMKESDEQIVYLCLGPLTNLAAVLRADSSLIEQIDRIIYSGTAPDVIAPSWNTARDIDAARRVFRSGIPIRAIHFVDNRLLSFDRRLCEQVCILGTPAADLISRVHEDERVLRLVDAEHFRCWDEMVLLSLLEPGLFTFQSLEGASNVEIAAECDIGFARLVYLNLLSGDISMKNGHRDAVVLKQYLTDPALLQDDIRPLTPAIIERHGFAEWNAALITSELHRHLGVYSLLGVKMGIRAREILEAGADELKVISHTGTEPPLSCMTDGLQVATGASLGRGTISVYPDISIPEALFIKESKQLTLRLKDDVFEQIKADFQNTIEQYGLLTPGYWEAMRKLALQYWLELDRRNIFHEALLSEDSYNVK